jgi:ribosomal protein S12 methylthiotransferase accessory factor YcaO
MKLTPAETIARLGHALEQDFRLLPLEVPEAPLFLAIALPADEGVTGLKPRLPAGRGLTTQQALLSAGAEALELRASLAQRHRDRLESLARQDGLAMVEATDLLDRAKVRVPAQEVYLDCAAVLGEPLHHEANSTGCAAGIDREAALAAALWECVERDAVALWWHGRRPAAKLPLEVIDEQQPRLYWWLHQRARRTMLLDLTSDIGLPVVGAVSADVDGRMIATGTAARPRIADAALAAVTEMVQTEVSLDMAREAGEAEALGWIGHGSTRTQPQFRADATMRDHGGPMAAEAILARLDALGHRALAVDLTLPEDPLPSVRVLVPGLCAMRGRIATPRFARLCPDAPGPALPEPY